MWVLIEGDYLNAATITRLEETDDGALIHLVDGQKIATKKDIDSISLSTGTVVAAHPGYEAVWLSTKTGKEDREPIAAWCVTGEDDRMWPVVPSGRTSWDAISYPSGRVLDREGRFYSDVDTWAAVRVEQAERTAKVGHSIAESASNA